MSHTQVIGPYTAGEIPEPIVHRFVAHDRTPLDLTGFDARYVWERAGTTVVSQEQTAAISNPTDGEVTYGWDASDLEVAGNYTAQIWVGDGANRYASTIFVYEVEDGPGTPPTI